MGKWIINAKSFQESEMRKFKAYYPLELKSLTKKDRINTQMKHLSNVFKIGYHPYPATQISNQSKLKIQNRTIKTLKHNNEDNLK